jgi:hypothetical protein
MFIKACSFDRGRTDVRSANRCADQKRAPYRGRRADLVLREILRRHTRSVVGRAKPIPLASKMRRAGVLRMYTLYQP